MRRIAVWKRMDMLAVEYAEIQLEPLQLEGDVILGEGPAPCSVWYRVECDAAMATRRAFIRFKSQGILRELSLTRSARGAWCTGGIPMPNLHGIADVDLSITPSTNTLAIRRLKLTPGQAARVTAAWVRFPELDVVPLQQVYRCITSTSYEYEVPDLSFSATLHCDGDGIVQNYGDLWRAVE